MGQCDGYRLPEVATGEPSADVAVGSENTLRSPLLTHAICPVSGSMETSVGLSPLVSTASGSVAA